MEGVKQVSVIKSEGTTHIGQQVREGVKHMGKIGTVQEKRQTGRDRSLGWTGVNSDYLWHLPNK